MFQGAVEDHSVIMQGAHTKVTHQPITQDSDAQAHSIFLFLLYHHGNFPLIDYVS